MRGRERGVLINVHSRSAQWGVGVGGTCEKGFNKEEESPVGLRCVLDPRTRRETEALPMDAKLAEDNGPRANRPPTHPPTPRYQLY